MSGQESVRGATDTDVADVVEAAGHFRIYLGAAAGVGKTYAMLNEGRRRRDRGSHSPADQDNYGIVTSPWTHRTRWRNGLVSGRPVGHNREHGL